MEKCVTFIKVILLCNVKHDSRTRVLLSIDVVVITSTFREGVQ